MAEAEAGVSEQQEREQRAEAHALVGVAGALAGLSELPSVVPGFPSVPLPGLEDSVDQLADAKHLPPPLRLELLARLHVANRRQNRGLELTRFASSLLREQSDSGARDLLQHLDHWVEGTDPLRRATLFDMQNQSQVASTVLDELQCTALAVRPGCGAVTETIQGHQALSIVTDMITCKEFGTFGTIVDPLQWPDCWLQKTFFKSMIPQSPKKGAPDPDHTGWTREVEETCDFFFDLPGSTSPYLRTRLNFLYFSNPPPAPPAAPGGARAARPRSSSARHFPGEAPRLPSARSCLHRRAVARDAPTTWCRRSESRSSSTRGTCSSNSSPTRTTVGTGPRSRCASPLATCLPRRCAGSGAWPSH